MSGVTRIRGGAKNGGPTPTWCIAHRFPTSGWPGSWGQWCALSQNDCVVMYKPGVKTMQGHGVGPCDPVSWHIDVTVSDGGEDRP